MNYFTFRALEKAWLYEKYATDVFSGWKKMLDLHCTTWCENPDSPRSECHGWSSAPMYEISAMVMGVYPVEDGFAKVRVAPVLPPQDFYAKGRVPVPRGYIDVEAARKGGKISVSVKASHKMAMEIKLPGCESISEFTDEYFASAEV